MELKISTTPFAYLIIVSTLHTHTHTHTYVFWALGVASGDLGSAEVLGYGRWVGEQKRVQVSIDVPTVPPHP